MNNYWLKCSMNGLTDDPHALLDWQVYCDTPEQARELTINCWKDEVFTGFKVLEVTEMEEEL